MDLPPGMPLSDHQAAVKLPSTDHYGHPQIPSEPHGPPPITRYTNLAVSPKGLIRERGACQKVKSICCIVTQSKIIHDWPHGFSDILPVSGPGSMLPLQGGHGEVRLQTASPQSQAMTPAPRSPTPTQPPPQQQAQQASQQPSLPPAHPHGQNGYSGSKHSQNQAVFHSELPGHVSSPVSL